MASRRLHSQIHAGEQGAGGTRRRSPRLHPEIHTSDDGAGVTGRIRRRRRTGTSPASAAASLPDDDDMLREILIRLSPQPSCLPRVDAVSKRWRGLVTDPKFLRQFYAYHRRPPLLGVFERRHEGIVFSPVLDPPDRISPQRFSLGRCSSIGRYDLLDCRHGLVLVMNKTRTEVVVCDPITGQQRRVTIPLEFGRGALNGAVLCAADDQGHVHGSCHSGPFKVVALVSTYGPDSLSIARVYSSESDIWGNPISTQAPLVSPNDPAVLVGNCLYWLSLGGGVIEFDLDQHNLTFIPGPQPATIAFPYGKPQIIRAESGVVGYALLSCRAHFQTWRRNANADGVATWVPWKIIELHSIITGLPSPKKQVYARLLGYDEDTDVLFLSMSGVVDSAFMVQFKLMQSMKFNHIVDHLSHARYYPFKSFYTPAINGEFNEAEMLHDA